MNGLPLRRAWCVCRWIFTIVVALVAVAATWLYYRVDEELRREIEGRLRRHYRDLSVTLRSARLVRGEGIELRGLSIFDRLPDGEPAEILYVDEAFAYCTLDLDQLLQGRLDVSRVLVKRPTVRAARLSDGTWNVSKLLPPPQFSDRPPTTIVEQASLEVAEGGTPARNQVVLRDGHFQVSPQVRSQSSARRVIVFHIAGTAGGEFIHQLDFEASVVPETGAFTATGKAEGLEAAPQTIRSLSRTLPILQGWEDSLRAQGSCEFRLAREAGAKTYDYEVQGALDRGIIDHPWLPAPVTELRARFSLTPNSFELLECVGTSGETTLALTGLSDGLSLNQPARLSGTVRRLRLDRKLLDATPRSWQHRWSNFLPQGTVDLDFDLQYDGSSWKPKLLVNCVDVSFLYHKFPYRLTRGKGKLSYLDDNLRLNLAAFAEGQEVRLKGSWHLEKPQPKDFVEIRGDDLSLDEKLFEALPQRQSQFVRDLRPRGTFNAYALFERGSGPQRELERYVKLTFNRCSFRPVWFPYPLSDVRGEAELRGDTWEFRRLEGTNESAEVTGMGTLRGSGPDCQWEINLTGRNVPLDPELHDALGRGYQKLWADLRPEGAVNVQATIRKNAAQSKPDVNLTAWPVEEPQPRSSLHPVAFPYRLEQLRGTFQLTGGRLSFTGLRAQHGRMELSTSGTCQVDAHEVWELHLFDLAVTRLKADSDLLQAVPERLRRAITSLQPAGTISLAGQFRMVGSTVRGGPPVTASWDLDAGFHEGRLECSLVLDHIQGGAHVKGGFDGTQFRTEGELNVDSLTARDLQFTNVTGPFWLDDRRIKWGALADRGRGIRPERPVRALAYGGGVEGSGEVIFGATPVYKLQANVVEADLDRFVREWAAGSQDMSGKVWATVDLRGQGSGLYNLRGKGELSLRDADLYELPLIVALLSTLSGRLPDSSAFNSSDMNFRIDGEHVYLDLVRLTGDAISLEGQGEVSLNREVRLDFYTMVGRDEIFIPLVRPLLGGASQQLMLVEVRGNLHSPQVKKRILPAVNKALEQLQGDLQSAPATAAGSGRVRE